MKKVKRRATSALLIAVLLIVGMVTFAVRYVDSSAGWVMYSANQNIYNNGVLANGTLTDRNGVVLAHTENGTFYYADDYSTRVSCLHAVGDFSGNIGTGALKAFSARLAGYSLVTGIKHNGTKLALTIDSKLNNTAYSALWGRKGSVLVMDYTTGEIICMVSSPSYDPNTGFDSSSSAYDGVYLNRGISSSYTPGSVFKLITTAAAIENIGDLYDRTFYCSGSVEVDGSIVNCTGVHGTQTIEQALANSCNCAFAELSLELGGDTLAKYAEKFGITDSHSLNGIDTKTGSFDIAESGSVDEAWSGIGQYTDLVCPYSMLRYVSGIANGGTLKEPTLLKGKSNGTSSLLSAETAEKLKEMMSYNVTYSYGTWNFPGLALCAKSGTAEVGDGTSHAWFTGFLDDEEHPYAFVVVIENGGGGLANAGSVANTVLQAAVNQ